jgi:hypothetical protein
VKLLDWIFGASNSSGKVLDAGISGIDKLVYTEEEKAEARSQLLDHWIKLQATLGEETTVRGVTRRILAVMFCGAYVLLTLLAAAVWPWGDHWKAYADFLWEVANGQYGWITMTVVVFYFGPYVFERFFSPKKA